MAAHVLRFPAIARTPSDVEPYAYSHVNIE